MYEWIIYCEDSIEGIFTAIYEAYENRYNHDRTYIQTGKVTNYLLTENSYYSQADGDKTRKVANTIIREFGKECYIAICKAIASWEDIKADSVYHMIVHGITNKRKFDLINDLSNPYVLNVFRLAREVNNEIMHLHGFIRFSEIENGMLLSKIGPKNNIITFIAPHFENRFPLENFAIYDEIRGLFVIHPAGKQFVLVTGEKMDDEIFSHLSVDEEYYQKLFKTFCTCIAIRERKNIKLQTQMLPLRFRDYMTEFQ